jgi:hypothetical protein
MRVSSAEPVDQAVLLEALGLNWPDFEDAVQMAAAARSGAEYLIARNPADSEGGTVPDLQPTEFTALLRGTPGSVGLAQPVTAQQNCCVMLEA